ncbi:alpha/beta hydrolase [Melaminivora sp.]|jgi:predicted alpha/beta hydrolase family esterase
MNPNLPVLLLPGWQNSLQGHWQTEWEQQLGYQRVQQHDWLHPRRGDWSARLDEVIADAPGPVLLAAHSLGCILTAWWAAHSRHTGKVRGALLVAPGDVEQPELAAQIPGWTPIARQRLPFAATLVASQNDPYCRFARAAELARDWGAALVDAGACGHLNAESGLGLWPQGQAWLQALASPPTLTT